MNRRKKAQAADGPGLSLASESERQRSTLALQVLVALAVIAATLLDPLHAAITVCGLVGVVLIEAAVHPGLARAFLRVFRADGHRENRVTHRHRRGGGRLGL